MKKRELKQQIKALKEQLHQCKWEVGQLIDNPNSFNSQVIKMGYQMSSDIERCMWEGDIEKNGDGIASEIKNELNECTPVEECPVGGITKVWFINSAGEYNLASLDDINFICDNNEPQWEHRLSFKFPVCDGECNECNCEESTHKPA
jgi:hypothetical protein